MSVSIYFCEVEEQQQHEEEQQDNLYIYIIKSRLKNEEKLRKGRSEFKSIEKQRITKAKKNIYTFIFIVGASRQQKGMVLGPLGSRKRALHWDDGDK